MFTVNYAGEQTGSLTGCPILPNSCIHAATSAGEFWALETPQGNICSLALGQACAFLMDLLRLVLATLLVQVQMEIETRKEDRVLAVHDSLYGLSLFASATKQSALEECCLECTAIKIGP